MKKLIIVVSAISLIAMTGCANTDKKGNSKPVKSTTAAAITTTSAVTTGASVTTAAVNTSATPAAVAATTTAAVSTEGALAVIGNEIITEKDVSDEFENLPEQYKQYYMSEEGKKRILDNLINQKILKLVAVKEGIDKEEAYKSEMDRLSERVLANFAVRKNILEKVKATDEEIEAKYNEQKEQYKTAEEVKAQHILLMFKPNMTDDEKKALYTKIEGILKEINEGKDFSEAAIANSEDGSASSGGNLGWFGKGVMVKPFEDACFEAEVGKVYPKIVETQFGYHLVKVIEKKPAGYKAVEEVKDKLAEEIVGQKRNDEFAKWMDALRKEYLK